MDRTWKILVVDDTPQNIKVLDAILSPRGYTVVAARSGAEALQKVRDAAPDLVLLDILMPGMSGYEVAQLADWNRTLEERVSRQVQELERLARLRRFLAPQLAELIASDQHEQVLESHRREVTVVFCDLRGFTAFAETTEPEEVMRVLREFHTAMGEIIHHYEGTLERFAGDGMMIFFNDPLPCADPVERAIHMAVSMRSRVGELKAGWLKRGHHLDFGVGMAQGYATLGKIGFEGRFDYAAIGTVTNLAARLCDEARGDQILVSQRVYSAVEALVETEPVGELSLKGFSRPLPVYNIIGLKETPYHENQPSFSR
jgi:adenylate cyclase